MIQQLMAEEGLKCISAQTDQDAVGFYRRCGFTIEEVVVEYPDGLSVRYNCELRSYPISNLSSEKEKILEKGLDKSSQMVYLKQVAESHLAVVLGDRVLP